MGICPGDIIQAAERSIRQHQPHKHFLSHAFVAQKI